MGNREYWTRAGLLIALAAIPFVILLNIKWDSGECISRSCATQQIALTGIECSTKDGGEGPRFTTLQRFWSAEETSGAACEVRLSRSGALTDVQVKALETASGFTDKWVGQGNTGELERLYELYTICTVRSGAPIERVSTTEEANKLAGAFVLCPNHPEADRIRETLAEAKAAESDG